MKIGILGFPKTGKTTVFNALTGLQGHTDKYVPVHHEANVGVVNLLDERVIKLSEIYQPKKTVFAQFEYYDFPAIFARKADAGFTNLMNEVKSSLGLVLVLRNFEDGELDELYGKAEPLSDLQHFEEEMILEDLTIAEKRLEKIELGFKRGVKTPALQHEADILKAIIDNLSHGQSLRYAVSEPETCKAIKSFQFLSQKPLLVLLNCSEANFHESEELARQIQAKGYPAAAIAGKFEEELAGLEEEDAAEFMADMGISESVRSRVSHLCYDLMGYISFFTVSEEEVHAWTLTKGETALQAAGEIHSDMARGFIRAECFQYNDLIHYNSEKVLREKGLFKLEGKEYIVKDGDIMFIRFNV